MNQYLAQFYPVASGPSEINFPGSFFPILEPLLLTNDEST